MPTKHIPETTWRKVEKEAVKAVLATKEPIKDTELLNVLILKGLSMMTEDDYRDIRKIHRENK